MSILPADLLAFGKALANATEEVALRASVSRSYYAAYHAVKPWYESLPHGHDIGPRGGIHQRLVNELRNPSTENSPEIFKLSWMIGAQLEVVKTLRRVADYDLDKTVDVATAANTHSVAKTLCSKI